MTDFGTDVACLFDADPMLTPVSGVALVKQDAFHRLTTDDVIGPGGDGWGFDIRQLLGAPARKIAVLPPILSEVLQRDPRILTADVTLTAVVRPDSGLADVVLRAVCTTAEGPFDIVLSVLDLTTRTFDQQAPT